MPLSTAVTAAVVLLCATAAAQVPRSRQESGYTVRAATTTDGLLAAESEAWASATMITWGSPPYETRFHALWSRQGLWIRFDASDDAPWHTLTARDAPLWQEEVVEIFIDPDGDGRNYVEIEINPANVVCDLMIYEGQPAFRSSIDWDFAGLRTAGIEQHDSADATAAWTAVALLPWEGFRALPESDAVRLPPRPGDAWRFNVFRIKRPGGPGAPEHDAVYAAWSPPPGPSFHASEVFREMVFER